MGAHGRTMGRNRQSHETDVRAGSHEGPDVRQPVVFVMKIYIAPRWLTLAPFLLSEPFRRFVRIPRGARSHRNGLARWRQTVEDALRKVDDGRGDFATTRLWPDTAECPWDSAMSGHSPGGERPRPNSSRFFFASSRWTAPRRGSGRAISYCFTFFRNRLCGLHVAPVGEPAVGPGVLAIQKPHSHNKEQDNCLVPR